MKSYLSIIIAELAYKSTYKDFTYCLIKRPSLKLESKNINDKIIYHFQNFHFLF